ncbi:hypothetical protein HYQ45_003294 [Verticillium longisporum]|uniref:Uncharacterized protein n=2 Tax=Verticillium longisporum TaxID=100787 RepID=A0A8I2ZVJ8_VERLO|nr:hypothetical protein HYQ45_003294 [Verticillium longisporum]
MTSIQSQIEAAASKNSELLSILRETDHAPPSLLQQTRLLQDLTTELQSSAKRCRDLERRRESELKDHEKYRDSVTRRFLHKAVGRSNQFADKAAKEEREYFDVLQAAQRETSLHDSLKEQADQAQQVKTDLEQQVARHRDAQRALDELYGGIFAGPTQGFPEEDRKEQDGNQALQAYHEHRGKVEAEQHVIQLLSQGMQKLKYALEKMESALSHSRMDMFGGGSMADAMERSSLRKAEQAVAEARMQVLRAQRMSPFVGDLPDVDIAQGNIISDVVFDNIFTDMQFHDKIKASRESVRKCATVMNQLGSDAKGRLNALEDELREKEGVLESTRLALQKEREAVFERVLGGQLPQTLSANSNPVEAPQGAKAIEAGLV